MNSEGYKLIFEANGLVSEDFKANLSHFKELKRTLSGGFKYKNYPIGGVGVYFIPGGVKMVVDHDYNNSFVDPVPTDKDRIWIGHQLPRSEKDFYYRVDD